jgi:hypothetical protein
LFETTFNAELLVCNADKALDNMPFSDTRDDSDAFRRAYDRKPRAMENAGKSPQSATVR